MGQRRTAAVTLEHAAEPRAECDGAGERDRAADAVDDGRSGEVAEAAGDMTASQPSGPQAQWPMIG